MNYFDLLENEDVTGLETFLHTHNINEELHDQSLLYWAVHHNNLTFTTLLVQKGANVNHLDRINRTPLQIACYFGFVDIAKFLLENGANTEGCLERAQNGWDEHIQTDIIKLLNQ